MTLLRCSVHAMGFKKKKYSYFVTLFKRPNFSIFKSLNLCAWMYYNYIHRINIQNILTAIKIRCKTPLTLLLF